MGLYCTSCVVPDALKQLCFSMYFIAFDAWNIQKSHPNFSIDENTNALKIRKELFNGSWINAFGSFIIKKGETQTWNIRIANSGGSCRAIMFGIIDVKTVADISKDNFFCDPCSLVNKSSYSYYGYNGDKFHSENGRNKYGAKWDKNDIVTMELDMTETHNKKHGVLSFKKNNESQGILAGNIDLNRQYCMAVALIYNDEIELVHNN